MSNLLGWAYLSFSVSENHETLTVSRGVLIISLIVKYTFFYAFLFSGKSGIKIFCP